jgi:hypothetical protein
VPTGTEHDGGLAVAALEEDLPRLDRARGQEQELEIK